MIKKMISIICIIIVAIFASVGVTQAKYIIENKFEVANLNIDRTKPRIEVISIENTNKGYEGYSNKTHEIGITVKFKDKNIDKVFCDKEHVKLKIDGNYIDLENMQFTKINEAQGEKTYKIKLKNMDVNGKLTIQFIEGTVIDTSKLENEQLEVDTKIILDNVAPSGLFEEYRKNDGKVDVTIKLSEQIRKIEGWEFSQNDLQMKKEFTNNISYELPITDYAGNKSIVKVNIAEASYINLTYASHNSEIGWTYGYGNYDIAGGIVLEENPFLKAEALAFNFSGNMDNDFVQANAYVHTYWGDGSYGITKDGFIYKHGYNPSENTYKTMNSEDLVTIEGKKYLQFGGSGINLMENTDINGNNPIPKELAYGYPFGISGIKLRLKDYSEFSIIYQIYVYEVGWIKACSDGQQCMYSKDKPMSAIRVALVPKSEKQYVLDTWNKDV